MKTARIIKADGTETVCKYDPTNLETLKEILDSEKLDCHLLRDGRCMLVNQAAANNRDQLNVEATKIIFNLTINYPFEVCGDVAIVSMIELSSADGLKTL